MNDYRKLIEQIGVPKELESRVLSAARRQAAPRTAPRRGGRLLRGAVCAACALALVLGTVRLVPREGAALDYAFGLTAYAAETGETVLPNANGALALTSGTGIASEETGHYTGCLFQVTGEGIETVSLSVDRGGLYRSETRTGLTDGEVRRLFQQQERGELVCDVYGEDEDAPMNAEVMTALGAGVTERFDPEVRYGFWVPPEEYEADPDAVYDETYDIDLSALRPTVACPHLPENTKTIDELGKIEIQQAVIGSCTNGRIQDMREAAAILKGKKVQKNVRTIVIPATQEIYLQCIREGLAEIFVEAGAILSTPTCGPCLGGHMGILAHGERAVSTTNRNFVGRMGHVSSEIYLASPAVAAASAITGYITDPADVAE